MSLEIELSNLEAAVDAFRTLTTPRDVADLLEVPYSTLAYHIYAVPKEKRYQTFPIAKRSGEPRTIDSPMAGLAQIQHKLNGILQRVYRRNFSAHGFVLGKNIRSNADVHARRKFVLTVDIKDFFPCINFGGVRGMFIRPPYEIPPVAATVLAQLCCHENRLPQGAPTSPAISNMVCGRMDNELRRLAREHNCRYTRYADDLTFSTIESTFPDAIAAEGPPWTGEAVRLGPALLQVMKSNGFKLNPAKTRLQRRDGRQRVTGLTVNERPNVPRRRIRQLRAAMHAWRQHGLDDAAREFRQMYDHKTTRAQPDVEVFRAVMRGRLEFIRMVKSPDSETYQRLWARMVRLDPSFGRTLDSPAVPEARLAAADRRMLELAEWDDRQSAGRAFERVLTDMFTAFDLTPREPFQIVGEQIDGSFVLAGITHLVEAKWEKSPIGSDELIKFHGKLAGRPPGTVGLFISLSGYTKTAPTTIVRGRDLLFVMWDSFHLKPVLDGKESLRELLGGATRLLAEEANPYVSAEVLLERLPPR